MREFETEADTLLLEAETALFEARDPNDREPPRRVADTLRRAAEAVETLGTGTVAYDAEELRRLAARWSRGHPGDEGYAEDLAILKDIEMRSSKQAVRRRLARPPTWEPPRLSQPVWPTIRPA
jgi:inorganic triphosphatase YgiF